MELSGPSTGGWRWCLSSVRPAPSSGRPDRPWVALALARRGGFATDPLFVGWNLFGMLDLVVAVGLGALSSSLAAGVAGEVTTAPMARLPLVLIPAFLVPLFLMLHLAALFQARRRASSGRSGARA